MSCLNIKQLDHNNNGYCSCMNKLRSPRRVKPPIINYRNMWSDETDTDVVSQPGSSSDVDESGWQYAKEPSLEDEHVNAPHDVKDQSVQEYHYDPLDDDIFQEWLNDDPLAAPIPLALFGESVDAPCHSSPDEEEMISKDEGDETTEKGKSTSLSSDPVIRDSYGTCDILHAGAPSLLYICSERFRLLHEQLNSENITTALAVSMQTESFLLACDSIYALFYALPRRRVFGMIDALSPARRDVRNNIIRIRDAYNYKRRAYEHLYFIARDEWEPLLWLCRGLEFISVLINYITTNREPTMSMCAQRAYTDTLQKYHNPVMARIARFVLGYTISRGEFLNCVSEGSYDLEHEKLLQRSRFEPQINQRVISLTKTESTLILLNGLSANLSFVVTAVTGYLIRHRRLALVAEIPDKGKAPEEKEESNEQSTDRDNAEANT